MVKLPAAKKRRGKLHHLTHLLISSIEHLSENKCILFSRNIFTIPLKTQWKALYYINFSNALYVVGEYSRYFPDYKVIWSMIYKIY